MSSAAAALVVFPLLGSLPNHSESICAKFTSSGPHKQVVLSGYGPSSSSPSSSPSSLRVVSHISGRKPQTETSPSSRSVSCSFSPAGGAISLGENDVVSTSGRTSANVLRCSRIGISSDRAASLASGNGKRLQSKSSAGPDVLPSLNPNEVENSVPFVARDQSLEAPSPYPEGTGDVGLDGTEVAGAQQGKENENSLPTMEEKLAAVAAQKSKTTESLEGEDPSLPTMEDIIARAAQEGVKLQVMSFGPTFEIIVTNLDETQTFGKADGWIKWWWPKGKILHLESVKLDRALSKQVGNVFGAGFFVGAATLRYGFDQGCRTAELLAIYDDEVTHGKLVKYYNRLGFKTLYEANEEELKYFPDRVVWGGVGTRMDADCEELLRKWCVVLKPKANSVSRTKGLSSRAQIM